MSESLELWPVVIVGGGPGGAAAAITLAHHGLRPLVIEGEPGPVEKVGECLPPSANPILLEFGIVERLQAEGHLRTHGNRAVWGSSKPVEQDFLFGVHGAGWHLDRGRFEALLATLAREAGVDWRYGSRVCACCRRGGNWYLEIESPAGRKSVHAKIVVDATGRRSYLARQLGIKRVHLDRLVAASVTLRATDVERRCDSFTLVEAVPNGWWYSARIPESRLSVVYLTDSDLLSRSNARTRDGWLAMLQDTEATQDRVRQGTYEIVRGPIVAPANTSRLTTYAGEGWLAVGDAAVAYDPLSSYGITAALGQGFHAGQAIAGALIDDEQAISRYADLVGRVFDVYLEGYYNQYLLERRWPGEVFWSRRHEAGQK